MMVQYCFICKCYIFGYQRLKVHKVSRMHKRNCCKMKEIITVHA